MKEKKGQFMTKTRLAWIFGIGVLLFYLASAAGRITSSDGHTMFLLTQSLVERQAASVPDGNAEAGPDGRLYPKGGLGQALVSVPLYVAGKVFSPLVPARMRSFAVRAATSLTTAVAGALLAVVCVLLFMQLGLTPREAIVLAFLAAFGTPLWVYSKIYVAEILLALYLTLVLYGVVRLRAGGERAAGAVAGLGLGLAVLTKYAITPAAGLLALAGLPEFKRWRAVAVGVGILALLIAVSLWYNDVRTGSPLASGYGRQGTLAAFTTPLYVGLTGLLVSSGKGIIWFAPIVILVPAGLIAWWRKDRFMALAVAATLVVTTLLYASFEHWAGDGSWGPRYLVPLIPLGIAALAVRLAERERGRIKLWWATVIVLGLMGIAVQKGGVFVSIGAQMREAGDYPYERALNDPRFMSESHWNPYFSPIIGHWKMLARNLDEHRRGEWPRVQVSSGGGRIGLDEQQARGLTHGLDIWAAYAIYAGLPKAPVLGVWILLWLLGLGYFYLAWRDSGRLGPARPVRESFQPEKQETPVYVQRAQQAQQKKWSYLEDE
jgi:hypothetical protein